MEVMEDGRRERMRERDREHIKAYSTIHIRERKR